MGHLITLPTPLKIVAIGMTLLVPAATDLKAETPTRLTGFMQTSTKWLDSSDPTAEYGFYSFLSDGSQSFSPVSPIGPDNAWANCASTFAEGRYYCYDVEGSWLSYTLTYRVFDATTWELITTNSFTHKSGDINDKASNIPCSLMYDPTDGTIYAATHAFSNTESCKLATIDRATGEITALATIPSIRTAACDGTGNLYGVALDGNLYKIGKDGNCESMGSTGYWPSRDSEIKTGAAFNFRNGKMYWSLYGFSSEGDRNYNRNGVWGLLEIDPATGASNMTYRYPSQERFSALVIANAHPSAPDDISDLSFTATGADCTDGILTFTLPSVTYGQQTLTGDIKVSVVLDGAKVEDTQASPGSKYTKTFTALERGSHRVAVTLTANGHDGSTASVSQFFGFDDPAAVTNLTLVHNDATGIAELTWDAPVGVNGGAINANELRYKIERLPDGAIVSRSTKENSFSEEADYPYDLYSYRVSPYYISNPGNPGKAARSNAVKMGASRECPYSETFDTRSSMNAFTIIDANHDGNGSDWDTPEWIYDEQYGCAFYYGKRDITADDWLITPALSFEEGYVYKLTFKYYAYYGYGSKFDVVAGSAPTVEGMDNVLLHKETVSSFNDYPGIEETVLFVPRKGDKFLAFHHISDTMEHLSIDDILVERYVSALIPSEVSNLTAREAEGNDVVISFKMPTKNAGGQALTGDLSAKIFKDGAEAAYTVLDGHQPGEKISWTDKGVTSANHIYKVIPVNSEGDGFASTVSINLSKGTPGMPTEVTATLVNPNQVLLEWKPATDETDENGRPIDTANIRYLVYKPVPDADGNTEYRLIGRDLTECSYVDGNPMEGLSEGQQPLFYYVAAVNGDDEGYAQYSNYVMVGGTTTLPWNESWNPGYPLNGTWFRGNSNGATWYMRYKGYDPLTDAYDGSGVASCETDRYSTFGMGAFLSPRLDLTTTDSPELTFQLYCGPEYRDDVQLAVGIDYGDGAQHLIPGAVYYPKSETAGWQEKKVSLADYTSLKSASIAFYAYTYPENTVHIDAVDVKGVVFANEIALTDVTGPKETLAGDEANYTVELANSGSAASSELNIEMNVDGVKKETKKVSSLAPGASTKAEFRLATSDEMSGKRSKVTFRLAEGTSDSNNANNTLESLLYVKEETISRVTTLHGEEADNGDVTLSWNLPDESEKTGSYIDDAESYEAFAIDGVGGWTLIDDDGLTNYLMSDGGGGVYEWPNCREPQAFIVFDATDYNATLGFSPMSGSQYFAAWPAAGGENSDWLISPTLPGDSQLISFYIRSVRAGSDKINILVSSSENAADLSSYVKTNGAESLSVASEWTLMHCTLPEGTRHFAIQYVGNDGSGIAVDDIMMYGSMPGKPEGYNVYRNGERINSTPVATPGFTDTPPSATEDYRYTVTALYHGKESKHSNEYVLSRTGIDSTVAQGAFNVVSGKGFLKVSGTAGQVVNVYSIDGLHVASVTLSGTDRIALASGIYVVKSSGNHTVKTIVK